MPRGSALALEISQGVKLRMRSIIDILKVMIMVRFLFFSDSLAICIIVGRVLFPCVLLCYWLGQWF
jgi:hypothetical protein